jgi:predicted transcriptional regulator of viral defense system
MKATQSSLGPLEMQFFTWAQFKKREEIQTGDLIKALKLSAKQEADLLYNLSRRGLILKLWRGFYLVPDRLPTGGKWSPSPYFIINKYMTKLKAKYQVTGPAVFNTYGYSNQVASEFVIYNNRASKKVDIRQYTFIFAKVADKNLGATREFRPFGKKDDTVAIFSSQARVLLDAVADYKRFGTLPEAYMWIRDAIEQKKVAVSELVDITCKFGNTTTKKRLGWLLGQIAPKSQLVNRIANGIPNTSFLVPLIPENYDGPINKKWGVIENYKFPA